MPNSLKNNNSNVDQVPDRCLSPSDFMRKLRPECYSDTIESKCYSLSSSNLEYHLDTITARNETHKFEVFCRKLCERTICPNLRPNTGPEGGGDSKADSETYPVADEISRLHYIGIANYGRERWAFAFSAQKNWSTKVRKDVKSIVETGREYDKIIFVTSQFARAKSRACIEDELSKDYGIPVTIHDRSWIVNEIVEKDRVGLAFHCLGVGEAVKDRQTLGPTDYSRTQHLLEIEETLSKPESFRGIEYQLATEALVAANLSRNLERPRHETDGRFERAIRLADEHGTYRQKLESRYEKIWTAFWWFNDIQFLNSSYEKFENLALESDHVRNLNFLVNLHQLLVNSIVASLISRQDCRYDERTEKLTKALVSQANDPDRPSNSLEAQTSILMIEIRGAILAHDTSDLSKIWKKFSIILDKATGLIEFDAEKLVSLIEVVGDVAGNDHDYNKLIEQLAIFVSNRKSEGEGAIILLKHAHKLNFNNRFEMIRLLGRASIGFNKREYAEHLIEATSLLTLAYRSAGLLWAARATCIFVIASILHEGEEKSEIPSNVVPLASVWAWISLELGHIPDLLFSIQLLNRFVSSLPQTDEFKSKVSSDIQELDMVLACLFLNLKEYDLQRLEGVPDILEELGLFYARLTLLYVLGYKNVLRKDGSLPEEETDENIKHLLSTLKSNPVADNFHRPLIFNDDENQTFTTMILGMKVEAKIDEWDSILTVECILASLEAFFATIIQQHVIPHSELFEITVVRNEELDKPIIETNELDMAAAISWPRQLNISRFEEQPELQKFLIQVASHIMYTTCVLGDTDAIFEKLFTDEAVQHRIGLIVATPNSYFRVAGVEFGRLSDFHKADQHFYPLRKNSYILPNIELPFNNNLSEIDRETNANSFDNFSHREIVVKSVIDIHAWDQAVWKACFFCGIFNLPPCLAFLFENSAAGMKIFERWRARFGTEDTDEYIKISIIRNLPKANPHHYCVQITPKLPASDKNSTIPLIQFVSRSLIFTPDNSEGLDRFLADYQKFGAYYLLPATNVKNPQVFWNLSILKKKLVTKFASEVCETDIEFAALKLHGQFSEA